MRQSSNIMEPVTCSSQAFCGLGFDMERVARAAQCMTVTWAGAPLAMDCALPGGLFVSPPAGYELLVSLGREIRGR